MKILFIWSSPGYVAKYGSTVEMRDTDGDVYRAAEELGIDLSRRFEPSSVEEV